MATMAAIAGSEAAEEDPENEPAPRLRRTSTRIVAPSFAGKVGAQNIETHWEGEYSLGDGARRPGKEDWGNHYVFHLYDNIRGCLALLTMTMNLLSYHFGPPWSTFSLTDALTGHTPGASKSEAFWIFLGIAGSVAMLVNILGILFTVWSLRSSQASSIYIMMEKLLALWHRGHPPFSPSLMKTETYQRVWYGCREVLIILACRPGVLMPAMEVGRFESAFSKVQLNLLQIVAYFWWCGRGMCPIKSSWSVMFLGGMVQPPGRGHEVKLEVKSFAPSPLGPDIIWQNGRWTVPDEDFSKGPLCLFTRVLREVKKDPPWIILFVFLPYLLLWGMTDASWKLNAIFHVVLVLPFIITLHIAMATASRRFYKQELILREQKGIADTEPKQEADIDANGFEEEDTQQVFTV